MVLVYVDDIVCTTNTEAEKIDLFTKLEASYGIKKDQGVLSEHLGVEIKVDDSDIRISQSKCAKDVLKKFGFSNAHAVGNPLETRQKLSPVASDDQIDKSFDYRGALGMLMYLSTCTRPDLAYAVGQSSRFVARPSK